jgi:hypothetical protein
MISQAINSIPAEQEARLDQSDMSVPICASVIVSTSPSAKATPRADAPRDRPIDLSMLSVATSPPTELARSAVSSGHFIWTKCTSSGPVMSACTMASSTAARTSSAWALRPISRGVERAGDHAGHRQGRGCRSPPFG